MAGSAHRPPRLLLQPLYQPQRRAAQPFVLPARRIQPVAQAAGRQLHMAGIAARVRGTEQGAEQRSRVHATGCTAPPVELKAFMPSS